MQMLNASLSQNSLQSVSQSPAYTVTSSQMLLLPEVKRVKQKRKSVPATTRNSSQKIKGLNK